MRILYYFCTVATLICWQSPLCESKLKEHKILSSNRRIVWTKLATVCMRRDVSMTYKVKYNSERGCCPKLLFYSDEQYQRILFLKALQILREDEIAKITGRHETKIYPPNPGPYGRRRRSTIRNKATDPYVRYTSENKTKSFLLDLKRVISDRKSKISSNGQVKALLSFPPKTHRRRRRGVVNQGQGTNITYSEVIQKLYADKSSLFANAERRIWGTLSCKEAKTELTQVLDSSQIIELCPKAGISIDASAQGSLMCGGTIKPVKQFFLPGFSETQSWYGYSEKKGGNQNFGYWKENTWHVALLNCPGSPRMNLTYIIEFDIASKARKQTTDKDYVDPLLDTRCENTVLPLFSKQDGIERGKSIKATISMLLIYITTLISILLENKS